MGVGRILVSILLCFTVIWCVSSLIDFLFYGEVKVVKTLLLSLFLAVFIEILKRF